ncbi:MAG: hypothetical protein O3C29_07645 [Proteobacteria bacterium]|jgi:hypothetical protein|nr:hypothetical protein [Pseudomonadota bacterium]MDA1290987.1 hypothetical protein [Pseudomonadota bacterium]
MPTKKIHSTKSSAALNTMLFLGLLTLSPLTIAGEYTDELSECLLDATSEEDKLSLVKWMFAAMALHPAVDGIADVSLSARERANREMAQLIIKLLSRACFTETRLALRNEGSMALQRSFAVLGQVAATNLFSDPSVAAGLASLETYISAEDLENRLEFGQ